MKKYTINHDDIVKIFKHLDELPYKYVKNIVPYFESVLKEVKDESETTIEKAKERNQEDSSKN